MHLFRSLAAICLVLTLAGSACRRGDAAPDRASTDGQRRAIRSADLKRVALSKTTPEEVEQLFGAPDERLPGGSLVYRPVGSEATATSATTTFHFEGGTLSRICRSRR